MKYVREDSELPEAISEWGWQFHHLGIPTVKKMPGETYLPQFKFYVSGFRSSPFGVEWMRFEEDSPVSVLIQQVPHLAFEVQVMAFLFQPICSREDHISHGGESGGIGGDDDLAGDLLEVLEHLL